MKQTGLTDKANTDSSRTMPLLEQLFKECGVNASTTDVDMKAIDEGFETSPSHNESSQIQDQAKTEDEETRENDQGEELPLVTEEDLADVLTAVETKGNTG